MTELIWSKSRFNRFRRCKREYFLHTIAAGDGWRDEAGKEKKDIYFCKNLTRIEWYFYRLFREILHKIHAPTSTIIDELWRRFSYDRACGNSVFQELFYHELSLSNFNTKAETLLSSYCKVFKKSELARWLSSRELHFHSLELPLTFPSGSILLHTAPFALVNNRQTYAFLELAGERMHDLAALHHLYALKFRNLEPEKFRSCFYHLDSGKFEMPELGELKISESLNTIALEAQEMAEFFPDDVVACEAFSAIPGNRENCGTCRFRMICHP